jgi:apolipoprotein N-acyltransferase
LGQAALAWVLFEELGAKQSTKPKWYAGALRGWLFGTGVNVIVLRFVPSTISRFTDLPLAAGLLALLLLAMFQGVRWLVAGWLARFLYARKVPAFLAWGIGVWISTFVPGVFGWTVASGISPWRSLVQIADVVGERGVSALIAMSSVVLAEAVTRRSWRHGAIAIAIPALMMIAGALRIRTIEGMRERAPKARVTLVEPSTEARMRWDPREADAIVRKLTMLTVAAEQRGTDLVVWPEAAFPHKMAATSKTDLYGTYAILQPGVRTRRQDRPAVSQDAFARVRRGGPARWADPRAASHVHPRHRHDSRRAPSRARLRPDPHGRAQLLRGHAPRSGARSE